MLLLRFNNEYPPTIIQMLVIPLLPVLYLYVLLFGGSIEVVWRKRKK